jgi:5-methylcytosine-specific restriction endonuclease McrA
MPDFPPSTCLDCTRRATNGTKYCADHATKNRNAEHKSLYDVYRAADPIRKMYRCARWRRTRSIVLKRDILCRMCGHRAATDCDHVERARIVVVMHGEDEFYNPDRCQGLCHDCHSSKTATESNWAGAHD